MDHMLGETGATDAPRRHVDGPPELVGPGSFEASKLAQSRPEDPAGEPVDEVGLLGQGQKRVGVEQPVRRVLPADERLDDLYPRAPERGLRLVVQYELAVIDRVAQLTHQAQLRSVVMIELGVV